MGRKLRVYGGLVYKRGKQVRAIVAVYTLKELATILDMSLYYARTWWGETRNKEELKLALAKPLKIIYLRELGGKG